MADDHTIFRNGLSYLLNSQAELEVIGEAENGLEAVKLCLELKPDVILLDITMPGMSGLEAIKGIKGKVPEVKILVLTMYDDEEYLKNVLQLGGSGYLVKRAAITDVITAIREVNKGEIYIDKSLTKLLVKGLLINSQEPENEERPIDILTERDKEILRFIALGYTNKQIAHALFISIKTVENNKARLKEKLKLERRSELVNYAINKGLIISGNEKKL